MAEEFDKPVSDIKGDGQLTAQPESSVTKLRLAQTDGLLYKATIKDSNFFGGKLEKVFLSNVTLSTDKMTLEERLKALDTLVDNIQFAMNEEDGITSIAEAIKAFKNADTDIEKTFTNLVTKIKDEMAISQNRSQRFDDYYSIYLKMVEIADKNEQRHQAIKAILIDGIDTETGMPLTEEQITSLNQESASLNEALSLTSVYKPFQTITSFLAFSEDMDANRTEAYQNRNNFIVSFQPTEVANVVLDSGMVSSLSISTNKFLGNPVGVYHNGLCINGDVKVNEVSDGYNVGITLPSNVAVGDKVFVVALASTNINYPKSGGMLKPGEATINTNVLAGKA